MSNYQGETVMVSKKTQTDTVYEHSIPERTEAFIISSLPDSTQFNNVYEQEEGITNCDSISQSDPIYNDYPNFHAQRQHECLIVNKESDDCGYYNDKVTPCADNDNLSNYHSVHTNSRSVHNKTFDDLSLNFLSAHLQTDEELCLSSSDGDFAFYSDPFARSRVGDFVGIDLEEQALFLQLVEDSLDQREVAVKVIPTVEMKEFLWMGGNSSVSGPIDVEDTISSRELHKYQIQAAKIELKPVLKKDFSLMNKNKNSRVKFSDTITVFSEDFDEPQIQAMKISDSTLTEMCLMYDPPSEHQNMLYFDPQDDYRDSTDDLAFLLHLEFPDDVFEATAFSSDPGDRIDPCNLQDNGKLVEESSAVEEAEDSMRQNCILGDVTCQERKIIETETGGKELELTCNISLSKPDINRNIEITSPVVSNLGFSQVEGNKMLTIITEDSSTETVGSHKINELEEQEFLNKHSCKDALFHKVNNGSGISLHDEFDTIPDRNHLERISATVAWPDSTFKDQLVHGSFLEIYNAKPACPSDWMDPYEVSGVLRKNSQIRKIIEMNSLRRRLVTSVDVHRRHSETVERLPYPTQDSSTLNERLRLLTTMDTTDEKDGDTEENDNFAQTSPDKTLRTAKTEMEKQISVTIPHSSYEGTSCSDSIAYPFLPITSKVDSIFESSTAVPITDITTSCSYRIPQADSIETIKSHKLMSSPQIKTSEHATSFNKDLKMIFLQGKMFEQSKFIPSHSKTTTSSQLQSTTCQSMESILRPKMSKVLMGKMVEKRTSNVQNHPKSWIKFNDQVDDHSTDLEHLGQSIKKGLNSIECTDKQHNLSKNDDPTFGFARRPSVKSIKTCFDSEKLIQLPSNSLSSVQLNGSQMTWPSTERRNLSVQPSETIEERTGMLHKGATWKILFRKAVKTAFTENVKEQVKTKDKKADKRLFSLCSSKQQLRNKATLTKYLLERDERKTQNDTNSLRTLSNVLF